MKTAIAVLLTIGFPALTCAEELVATWKEVPNSLAAGRKVEVRLADGGALHGKAVAVTQEGLRMEITKVRGGARRYGPGESIVPANEIAMLKVDHTGVRGRIIGAAIGGAISAGAGWAIVGQGHSGEGPGAAGAPLAAIPAAAGYLLGWARDRHFTTLHVARQ
jgi:hypothetical protein